MGDAISNYARHRGIVESTMFFEFLEGTENSPETVRGLGFLDTLLRNELHETAESVYEAAVGQRVDELRTTRASYGFIHQIIKEGLVPAMIDDMVKGLVRIMKRREDVADPLPAEIDNVRAFTKAYQAALDTNAERTVTVDYDFLAWMQRSFNCDIVDVRLDQPMTLHVSRAHGRLPNARLESTDASDCTQAQFTEWLYFIRNTRDYVSVASAGSAAA